MTGLLDCGDSIASHAGSGYRPMWKYTTPGALHEIFSARRRGGQRMLGAGVAVVDGDLEEPGAGHTATGRRRSLGSAQPRLQRLIQAQVRGRQC